MPTAAEYTDHVMNTPIEDLLDGWYVQVVITFLLPLAVGYIYWKFHKMIYTFFEQAWQMVGLVLVIAFVVSKVWKPEVLCGSEIDFKILSALRERGVGVFLEWIEPLWQTANSTTTKTQILKAIQKNRGF
jgi:hypothetical protein